MTAASHFRGRARALTAATATALTLTLTLVAGAHAYEQPPGGSWRFQQSFDDTRGGTFALTRNAGAIAKLTLVPGEDSADECGTTAIRLISRPKVRSYRAVNGRYAVATLRRGLFVPIAANFRRDGRVVRGKLLVLWDQSGRLVDTGKVELSGDCDISFNARKGR